METHGVVLGGSIAGLLAARMVASSYDRVTVIDRDVLSDTGETTVSPRRFVPQGKHIHALLARGQQILDELFPGFTDELIALGVPTGDFGTSLSWYFNGAMIRKAPTGLVCVAAGRPLLESALRRRVLGLPTVELAGRVTVRGLVTSAGGGRVTGVRVTGPDDRDDVIQADLVVDATGRGTRTPGWLDELGYGRVPEERVAMDLTYTTCDFDGPLTFDPIGEDIALLPVATPASPRGAIFARLPDRYAVSLTGILGDRPPTDHEGFLEFARSLPIPEVYKGIRDATPRGEPSSFRFPASIRRRFERMTRFPAGLLAIGDAVCVFNPVYGQGMTVAAMEALVLGRHLGAGEPRPRQYFRELAKVVDAPWDMSAGTDLGFPGVRGRRTAKVRMGNAYIPRLQAAAVADGALSTAFLRTAGLVDPPQSLMRPRVIARVLRPPARPPVGE